MLESSCLALLHGDLLFAYHVVVAGALVRMVGILVEHHLRAATVPSGFDSSTRTLTTMTTCAFRLLSSHPMRSLS